MTTSPHLLLGASLGHYRIAERIGRGATSTVYAAIDERSEQSVALKVMAPELSGLESFRNRFIKESELAAGLLDPHIVPIFEAGESEGRLFIAMHRVEGPHLGEMIARRDEVGLPRLIEIVGQVGAALHAAHRAGLVHRDVKPQNILIEKRDGDDHAFLSDFGLTKFIDSESRITATGSFLGTIHYMAPEQIEGRAVDHRADIYSLGCVLYECLTGRVPFERENEAAILWAHMQADIPSVTDARPDLPSGWDLVVAAALAKRPEERYESCDDLLADLLSLAKVTRGRKHPQRADSLLRRHTAVKREAEVCSPSFAERATRTAALVAVLKNLAVGAAAVSLAGSVALSGGGTPEAPSDVPAVPRYQVPATIDEPLKDAPSPEKRRRPVVRGETTFPVVAEETESQEETSPPVALVPDVGPGERVTAPVPTLPQAPRAISPQVGTYRYVVEGYDEICQDNGTSATACATSNELPRVRTVTIEDAIIDGRRVLVEEAQMARSYERRVLTARSGKMSIVEFEYQAQYNGVTFSAAVEPLPGIQFLRLPLKAGSSWSGDWGGSSSGAYSIEVIGREPLRVSGRVLQTQRVLSEISWSGSQSGRSVVTYWIDPETNLTVKSSGELILGGGVSLYRSRFESVLTSGPGY